MNVTIRPLKIKDAAISWKWRNDPEIWELTGKTWNNHITKEMEESWIKKVIRQNNSRRFAICIGKDQKYIGNIQLTDINQEEAFSHMFIGEKKYWGKGIGTKAKKLLLNYAKQHLSIIRIKAVVKRKNLASIRSLEKTGYVFSHSIDEEHDLMIHDLSR